jgi:hypothetical protein
MIVAMVIPAVSKVGRDVHAENALEKYAYLRDLMLRPGLARLDVPGILHYVDRVSGRSIFKRIGTLYPKTNVIQAVAGGMQLKPATAVRSLGLQQESWVIPVLMLPDIWA